MAVRLTNGPLSRRVQAEVARAQNPRRGVVVWDSFNRVRTKTLLDGNTEAAAVVRFRQSLGSNLSTTKNFLGKPPRSILLV